MCQEKSQGEREFDEIAAKINALTMKAVEGLTWRETWGEWLARMFRHDKEPS